MLGPAHTVAKQSDHSICTDLLTLKRAEYDGKGKNLLGLFFALLFCLSPHLRVCPSFSLFFPLPSLVSFCHLDAHLSWSAWERRHGYWSEEKAQWPQEHQGAVTVKDLNESQIKTCREGGGGYRRVGGDGGGGSGKELNAPTEHTNTSQRHRSRVKGGRVDQRDCSDFEDKK